jgi:hypothetical protein
MSVLKITKGIQSGEKSPGFFSQAFRFNKIVQIRKCGRNRNVEKWTFWTAAIHAITDSAFYATP